MKFILNKGETNVMLHVFVQDSSSTVGAGLAGLDENSGITGGYVRQNSVGLALAVDQNVATEGTYAAPSTDNQVRIGTPANMIDGVYELHFHDDLFAAGGPDYVTVSLDGATDMAPLLLEIQLTDLDLNTAPASQAKQDAVVMVAGYLGDFELEDTVHFGFSTITTITPNSEALKVYKDDGDTPLVTAQATLDPDVENGFHQVSVVLGAANYDKESDYQVVLEDAVVGAATIAAVAVGLFSVQNRYQEPVHRQVAG